MGKKVINIIIVLFLTVGGFTAWRMVNRSKMEKLYEEYPKGLIRIKVLNGTATEGLAYRVTKVLRHYGFDVVEFGNADSVKYVETVLIDLTGEDPMKMKVLSFFLGTQGYVTLYDDSAVTEKVDAVIILGQDAVNSERLKMTGITGGWEFEREH